MTQTTATKPRAKRAEWQPHLLPIVPPTYLTRTIHIDKLPPNSILRGEPPDNDIVESVRMIGIVDPITVRPSASSVDESNDLYPYVVDDGGRRIKAVRQIIERLRAAGQDVPDYLEQIPARLILDMGDVGGAAIALQKHATRRRNKVAEYERVKRLVAAGATEADIHAETRLTKGQIRELLRLDTLLPDLLAAAGESRISWGQAHDIAALPESAQERLADILEETGRIKADEIARERVARREVASGQMDWGAIGERPATTGAEQPNETSAEDSDAEQRIRDLVASTNSAAAILGGLVLQAIGQLEGGLFRAEAVAPYMGKQYWIRVQEAELTEEPVIGDSDAVGAETASDAFEPGEAMPAANGTARVRPTRVKPCPHGGDVEQCDEPDCRRRRANTARMRAKRGILA